MGDIKGFRAKWNLRDKLGISKHLMKCNDTKPSELHRSVRHIEQYKYWKATEFRTFLLYIGVVALKNRVDDLEYKMFLKLHCAVTICSTEKYKQCLPLARTLFIEFIENHIDLYGESSITMNIHNTSHVVDDVQMFGPLNRISAYEFENHLHTLKLQLKQCNRPLQQIARRVIESKKTAKKVDIFEKVDNFTKLRKSFKLDDGSLAYRYFQYNVTENNLIVGSPLKTIHNFFEKIPFDSMNLNIFCSDGVQLDSRYYELNTIKAKMFSLPYESKWVFIPLLHSL